MRKLLGGVLLAAGVGGLGYWGAKDQALDIESSIGLHAQTAVAGAVHGVQANVDGRDIRVSGLANSEAERAALISALNDVQGRRVVIDALEVLPMADPFTIAATRKNGQTLLQGNVPSEAMRAALRESGASGVEGLTLASGAPERWEAAIGGALGTLTQMQDGAASLTGTTMRLTGLVDTPSDRNALITALTLPEGYTLQDDIETRDDGTPIGFDVSYDAASGVTVAGKLPKGLDLAQIGEALGVDAVAGDPSVGIEGDPVAALGILSKLKGWLPELESAKLTLHSGPPAITGFAAPGVNAALVQQSMAQDFESDLELSLAGLGTLPQSGQERINAATGQAERFEFGAWLPKIVFTPSLSTCGAQTEKLLATTKINFLSGSADLGPRAVRAINAMASVLGRCVRDAGLIAELGGHTDNTGSGNFELSAARAQAVRNAMIARGIDGAALSAVGYGASKPIADNASEEGRAANRRTTVRWAQQ
ncbi:OmpA family protein [Planktotalea arctica]|uniref:OmpA family protein n=1 Tax=Planktotalea arctica TaxID=1481893 RepID=UPI000A16D80B|nr:OmpA family protein [Planktotalea arctica]